MVMVFSHCLGDNDRQEGSLNFDFFSPGNLLAKVIIILQLIHSVIEKNCVCVVVVVVVVVVITFLFLFSDMTNVSNLSSQGFQGFAGFGDGFQLSFGIGAFPFAFFSSVSDPSLGLVVCSCQAVC